MFTRKLGIDIVMFVVVAAVFATGYEVFFDRSYNQRADEWLAMRNHQREEMRALEVQYYERELAMNPNVLFLTDNDWTAFDIDLIIADRMREEDKSWLARIFSFHGPASAPVPLLLPLFMILFSRSSRNVSRQQGA